ncbi:MAG: extracellular solute-binding protein [Actinobacteria bacterium]|nr:extracellular solute-binding protein [Actinomycetota bacterium]
MKTWLKALAPAVGLVLSLSACGAAGTAMGTSASQAPSAAISGSVTFWHAYSADSPELSTLEKVLIPKFESLHPGVTVKSVPVPYDSLHQKLVTAAAGEQLPDLVRSDIIWVPELANLDVIEPLDTTLPDFADLKAKVFPGPLATNKWKDHYYGLPLDTNTRVLMYNADALKKLGVTQPPATFDELKALSAKTAGTGVFAYAEGGTGGWSVLPWIWSGGGSVTDDAVTTATGHINGADTVAVVQMLADMLKQKGISDIILGGQGGTKTSDGLPKGQFATILDGPWMFPIMKSQYPNFDLKTAPIPAGKAGSISVVGGEDIVLTKDSKNKAAAAEFLRFLLSEDSQMEMAKTGQMPVLSSITADKLNAIQPYYGTFVEQLKTAQPRTPSPAWPKIDEVISKQVLTAIKGEATPQAAMDAAATQINALIAQYK